MSIYTFPEKRVHSNVACGTMSCYPGGAAPALFTEVLGPTTHLDSIIFSWPEEKHFGLMY